MSIQAVLLHVTAVQAHSSVGPYYDPFSEFKPEHIITGLSVKTGAVVQISGTRSSAVQLIRNRTTGSAEDSLIGKEIEVTGLAVSGRHGGPVPGINSLPHVHLVFTPNSSIRAEKDMPFSVSDGSMAMID